MTPTRVLYPVPVERDEDGNWEHPECERVRGDDEGIAGSNPVFAGVETTRVIEPFDDDMDAEYEQREAELKNWQPQPPSSDGWFCLSIGIDEDYSLVAWYARPTYEWLLKTCDARKENLEMCSKIINDNTVAMQSAIIESEHGGGTEAGMRWIWQALCGPGLLPDDEDDCGTDAQAWYDNNCYDALTEKQKKIEPAHSATATRRSREQS